MGYGRNNAGREITDHLRDLHGDVVWAYETGARGGYTVREVLDELMAQASVAVLVLTADDGSQEPS